MHSSQVCTESSIYTFTILFHSYLSHTAILPCYTDTPLTSNILFTLSIQPIHGVPPILTPLAFNTLHFMWWFLFSLHYLHLPLPDPVSLAGLVSEMEVDNIIAISALDRDGEGVWWVESEGNQAAGRGRGSGGTWETCPPSVDAELDESRVSAIEPGGKWDRGLIFKGR